MADRLEWLRNRAIELNARFKLRLRPWDSIDEADYDDATLDLRIALLRQSKAARAVAADPDDPNRNHVIPMDVTFYARPSRKYFDGNQSDDDVAKVYESRAGFFE